MQLVILASGSGKRLSHLTKSKPKGSFSFILELENTSGFVEDYDKVVYGMLTASLLSTLAGVYLPGKYSLFHSTRIFFHKPVFVGDTITVSGKVKEKDERYNIIKLKIIMENQDDKKVLSGSMQVGVTA